MYCRKCGSEIQETEKICLNCGEKNPDFKMKSKVRKMSIILVGVILLVVTIAMIANGMSKTSSYNNKIQKAKEEQTDLYKAKLIPALVGDFKDYTVNNVTSKEIDTKGQCDYAIQIDCELDIGSKKFNYPLIVLFNNNDESNPKYQNSDQATKGITDEIKRIQDNKKAQQEADEKQARLNEVVTITSKSLASAYNKNEVNANEEYSGKTGMITGKIQSIDVHGGKPCIVLDSGGSTSDVSCYFDNYADTNAIAKLKKGKTITVKGKISGIAIFNVCIDNCMLMS